MKHLPLGLQRCWSIAHAATVRPYRHACEVVSDKASKFVNSNAKYKIFKASKFVNSNTRYKILQVVIKQNEAMQYHLIVMVLAEYNSTYPVLSVFLSYDVGNIYFDLAQTQQHFQTIVQLAHARPTMSCNHLVCVLTTHTVEWLLSHEQLRLVPIPHPLLLFCFRVLLSMQTKEEKNWLALGTRLVLPSSGTSIDIPYTLLTIYLVHLDTDHVCTSPYIENTNAQSCQLVTAA